MSIKTEYPKMLYKANASINEAQGKSQSNSRIGYCTAQTLEEEEALKKKGWVNNLNQAEKILKNFDQKTKVKYFLISNWKFWVTTLIGIVGIYIAYLSVNK